MIVALTSPSTADRQSPRADALACAVEDFDRDHIPARDAWLALFERAPRATVFHHPDYIAAVAIDHAPAGFTITCSRNGTPQAIAVLIAKHCRFGRPLLPGARTTTLGLRLAGSAFLGSNEPAVVETLVNELARQIRRRNIRVVEFEELSEDSILWTTMQRLRPQGFRFAPAKAFDLHHRIHLAPTPADYWKTFNSKHRLRMRKEREKLGHYQLKRFTRPAEVDDWLTAAHEISRMSWQSAQLGLRIQNSESDRRFLQFLANVGAWRSYILYRDRKPAAFALSFQWKAVYYYDEIGFDRRLVKLFPGKVMLQEILNDLMTHDHATLFDFGLGDAEYKQFFANEHARSAKLWMFSPGLRGFWQTASINLRRTLGKTARNLVAHMPWYERLRSKLRNAAAKSAPCVPGALLLCFYQALPEFPLLL
jgi:CelD/BcsL family acetyltransferase involved in cellulose biosynthesis